jgi:predicted amidophosphoribosyltransferase
MLLKQIINLIFPEKCVGCGKEGDCLCKSCLNLLNIKPICERVKNKYFDEIISFGIYRKGSAFKKMIIKVKYKYSREIMQTFDEIIKNNIPKNLDCSIIIPSPIQKRRLRQ